MRSQTTRPRVACHAGVLRNIAAAALVGKVAHGSRWEQKSNMPRIDDLSDAEFMKLQAEYGDNLPICPICTLEDVRHLLLELVVGDAVPDEVKSALGPVCTL